MDTTTILIIAGVVALLLLAAGYWWRNVRARRAEDARFSRDVTREVRRQHLARELQPPHRTLSDAEVDQRIERARALFDSDADAARDPEQPAAPTDPNGLRLINPQHRRYSTRNTPRLNETPNPTRSEVPGWPTADPTPSRWHYDGFGAPISHDVEQHRTDHQVDYTPAPPASSHDSGSSYSPPPASPPSSPSDSGGASSGGDSGGGGSF